MIGQCGRHPELHALLACERCGTYACEACIDDATALCASCVEAGHAGIPVPWETPAGGFWVTLRDAWTSPRKFFGSLPSGDSTRAYLFAVFAGFFYYGPLTLAQIVTVATARPGGSDALARAHAQGAAVGGLCAMPIGLALGTLVACGTIGTVLFAAGALAGARARFGDTFRLAAYSQAYLVVCGPAYLVQTFAPRLGAMMLLAAVPIVVVMQIVAYQAYFEVRQRRSPLAAVLIAVTPLGLLLLLCGSVFVIALFVALGRAASP